MRLFGEANNCSYIQAYLKNMNNNININKKIKDMNNTDLVVKYTFGTMAATLLIMNIGAFGVVIVNAIISLI